MKTVSRFLGLLLLSFGSIYVVAQSQQPPSIPVLIHGKVTVGGRPVNIGFRVSLRIGQGSGSSLVESMTDSNGSFEFRSVPNDLYTVVISEPGYRTAQEIVDVRTVSTAYVMVDMKPLPSDGSGSQIPAEGPGAMISVKTQNIPPEAKKQFDIGQQALISKPEDAAKAFKKATEIYPKFEEAQLWLGFADVSTKNYEDAEKAFTTTLALNNKSAAAYTGMGMAQNFQGKFPEAEQSLIKASSLDPQSAEAQFQLGKTYAGLQRWPDAATHLQRSIQLKPGNAEAHVLLGNVMLRERNAEGALKEYQEAVRVDPKGPMAAPAQAMVDKIQNALKSAKK